MQARTVGILLRIHLNYITHGRILIRAYHRPENAIAIKLIGFEILRKELLFIN